MFHTTPFADGFRDSELDKSAFKMIPSGSSGFNINEQTDLNIVKKDIEEDPYNYYPS